MCIRDRYDIYSLPSETNELLTTLVYFELNSPISIFWSKFWFQAASDFDVHVILHTDTHLNLDKNDSFVFKSVFESIHPQCGLYT